MLKLYSYEKCGTCKKAIKYLDGKGVEYKLIPIREKPPTNQELKKMLKFVSGDLKKLFNTSGMDYRSMGIKDKLPKLSEAQALKLLSQHGNLVKRPFVLSEEVGLVGFKPDQWDQHF